MSDFYTEMQGVAANVLREFKQGEISYIAITPGNGPKHNPGAATETVYPLDAVCRPVRTKYVDGTNIVSTDEQVTMPGGVVEPAMSGFVSVDGKRYKIIELKRNPAAGVAVAHILIFRR